MMASPIISWIRSSSTRSHSAKWTSPDSRRDSASMARPRDSRSVATTRAPSRRNSWQMARPTLEPAPVITATLSFRRMQGSSYLSVFVDRTGSWSWSDVRGQKTILHGPSGSHPASRACERRRSIAAGRDAGVVAGDHRASGSSRAGSTAIRGSSRVVGREVGRVVAGGGAIGHADRREGSPSASGWSLKGGPFRDEVVLVDVAPQHSASASAGVGLVPVLLEEGDGRSRASLRRLDDEVGGRRRPLEAARARSTG